MVHDIFLKAMGMMICQRPFNFNWIFASWNYGIPQMDFRIWKIIMEFLKWIFQFGKLVWNSQMDF